MILTKTKLYEEKSILTLLATDGTHCIDKRLFI